jgi:hypothetical protein
MLCAGMFLEFVEDDGPTRVHVLDSLANAFEHPGLFGRLTELLVGGGVLDDQRGLAKPEWVSMMASRDVGLCPICLPNSYESCGP